MRKRKYVIGVAVMVAALLTAVVAFAATERTYKQDFSTKNFTTGKVGKPTTKPNSPSGTYFIETATDPQNTDGNNQPKQDQYVDDIFPSGAKIDQSAAATCKASDNDILQQGDAACPKKSKIGSGKAILKTKFSSAPDINAVITAYNCQSGCKPAAGSGIPNKNEIIFYINPGGSNQVILRGSVGKKGKSPKLHVPIPINCVLGTPPDCGNAGDARITSFELSLNKINKKFKKNGKTHHKPFLKTPPKCPASKNWVFNITFHGRDGTDDKLSSKSPCKS